MTDALIVGDVHLSDRAPSSRRDTWADEIMAKIAWCVIYANHPGPGRGPLPLVFAGDMFHIKTPWRTSYGLVQRVHSLLCEVEAGVWIDPGNHDLSHDRLESLGSQPLGALCRMGNVRLLIGHDPDLPGINGIPWHGEFDGGKWKPVVERYLDEWQENGTLPDLVITHAPLFPPGQEPKVSGFASIPTSEWATGMQHVGIDATYYGHIHDQHGSYKVDGHLFCNNGAISRGSIHEESVNRWPTITEWVTDQRRFDPVPLPESVVKKPEEVFLFEQAEKKKQSASVTDAYEQALGEVKLPNLTIEEVLAYVREENPSPTVLRVVEESLEAAGA